MKFVRQISYYPANGVRQGNYFLPKSHKLVQFCSAIPEIIGVKVYYRQTDKFFDTIYGGVLIFSFS